MKVVNMLRDLIIEHQFTNIIQLYKHIETNQPVDSISNIHICISKNVEYFEMVFEGVRREKELQHPADSPELTEHQIIAIELLKTNIKKGDERTLTAYIKTHINKAWDTDCDKEYSILNSLSLDAFIKALYSGYKPEKGLKVLYHDTTPRMISISSNNKDYKQYYIGD